MSAIILRYFSLKVRQSGQWSASGVCCCCSWVRGVTVSRGRPPRTTEINGRRTATACRGVDTCFYNQPTCRTRGASKHDVLSSKMAWISRLNLQSSSCTQEKEKRLAQINRQSSSRTCTQHGNLAECTAHAQMCFNRRVCAARIADKNFQK